MALARRTLRNNREGELGEFLRQLVREIEEDRAALLELMRALGVPRNPVKEPAARAFEVVGRLKLNGRLRGYSPLSRVLELEGLRLGVESKRALWRSLEASGRWVPGDLNALVQRAEGQLEELERHRAEAAQQAFRSTSYGSSSSSSSQPAGPT